MTSIAWARLSRPWLARVSSTTLRRVDAWFSPVESLAKPMPAWVLLAVDDADFEAWVTKMRAVRAQHRAA